MSEGRLGRPDYFSAMGNLCCGCGWRMDYFECIEEDEDGEVFEDLSQWQCRNCNHAVYGGPDFGRADPVKNPWGWRSMIATALQTGLEFEHPSWLPWGPPPNGYAANAFVVAFHLMALEAQCPA